MFLFAMIASAVALAGNPDGAKALGRDDGKPSDEAEAHWFFDEGYGEILPGSNENVVLWRASGGRKVPRRRNPPAEKCKGIGVRTAANEAEAVQLVVTPKRTIRELKVNLGPLPKSRSGEELPVPAFDILRVGYVPVGKPSDRSGCPAMWPDPLPPQRKDMALSVPRGENQPFWIRVKPPKGTQKGVYRSEIWVDCMYEDGSYEMLRVPLAVEVFGFSMPDVYACQAMCEHDPEIFRYHNSKGGESRAAIADAYFVLMGESHVSPCHPAGFLPVSCRFAQSKDGDGAANAQASIDWRHFDRRIGHALSTYHFNAFCVSLAGFGKCGGASSVPKDFCGFSPQEPEYGILMGKYLSLVEAHLREKGWLGRAYVCCRGAQGRQDRGCPADALGLLEKYAPGLRRMDGSCPLGARAFIDRPGSDMRVRFWQAWKDGTSFIFVGQTVRWNSKGAYPDPKRPQNPYLDAVAWRSSGEARTGDGNGCGRFIYPPLACFKRNAKGELTNELQSEKIVFDAPVGSMRLDMIRDGIEDYEYFELLKKLDPGNALLKVPPAVFWTAEDCTKISVPMEEHRLKMAREIERLAKRR